MQYLFSDVAFYYGILKGIDVVEPYLRQFGWVQYIPSSPVAPTKCWRGAKPNQYHVDYPYITKF